MPESWAISGVDLHVELRGSRIRRGLEEALREAVRSGRLASGARLPPSRSLALDLGVARNTVAAAYEQLAAEGWLEARQGAGTWVAARALAAGEAGSSGAFELRAPRYDLRAGSPDLAAFPRSDWIRAGHRALRAAVPEAFGYGDARGRIELRRALAEYLARARGVDVAPERIVVCSGFAQGLALIADALRAACVTSVAVEAFGHRSHSATLAAAGLVPSTIAVDEHGARVEAVDGAGALLLTPAHQFPLGATLVAQRRLHVVAWARANDAFVIEDDYDGEFRYDRQPIGALQALAPEQVIYAGTASKSLAPGLRLGWLVLPPSLLEPALAARQLTGGPSTFEQLTMADFITSGAYDRHIRRARATYRRRRDKLVQALTQHLASTTIRGASAGLHLLVELPADLSEQEAVARGLTRGLALEGLASYRIGAAMHPPALIVGYGMPPEHAFTAAITRLCGVLRG